ncbi:mitochondrial carrier [Marasmius fiardii PR-910]|nr:mitochondrial carrier [Marasmius fiardii PR-910]
MTSTLPPLVQAVTGSIGSASANFLTYPVDLATARLQLQPQTYGLDHKRRPTGIQGGFHILYAATQKYGLSALYDGLLTDTGATLLSNFFYFYFYSSLRDIWQKRNSKNDQKIPLTKLSILEELFLGFLAGVASRAISTPLSLITLRLQTERSNDADEEEESESRHESGVRSVVRKIYNEDGLAGFWKGFQTTTLLCLNPSLTLSFFQVFRRALALSKRTPKSVVIDPTPREAFVGGAISSSIAVSILYPLILAKTRLQARKKSRKKESPLISVSPPSLMSVLQDAYVRDELYQGLEMQIVKGFISQGVTFLVKGRIEQLIVNEYLRRKKLPK